MNSKSKSAFRSGIAWEKHILTEANRVFEQNEYFAHASNILKAGHSAGCGDTMINENHGSVPQGTCSLVGQTGKRIGRHNRACVRCS